MSSIRGVLLAGKFRAQSELNRMSNDDQRNTLIVEISNRTTQSAGSLQGMNDAALAGTGAILVFVREAKIRTDQELKTMSADDIRNTLIVEIDAQTHLGNQLQGFSNMDLVLSGLGLQNHRDLEQPSFLRGVLLAGKFRMQHELTLMSHEDHRNTLIVELSARSNQSIYQAFNDWDLAGIGAALVFLREAKIRTDLELKSMNAEDLRNTLIVEMESQTSLGVNKLQSLTNMNLVRLGLGIDPAIILRPLPGPLQPPINIAKLDLVIRAIREHQSNDSGLQGATDEVHAALGVAHDSADIYVENGTTKIIDHKVSITNQDLTQNGNVFPINVYSFDLVTKISYPRTCMVTLFVIEEDNASLEDDFNEIDTKYREEVKSQVAEKGAEFLGAAGGVIAGPVGAFIGKEILGRVWAYVAGEGIDAIANEVREGLANDFMPPFIFKIEIPDSNFKFANNSNSSGILTMDYRGADDAHYGIDYEWISNRL